MIDSYDKLVERLRSSIDDLDLAIIPMMEVFTTTDEAGHAEEHRNVGMILRKCGGSQMFLSTDVAEMALNSELLQRHGVRIVLSRDLRAVRDDM